MIDLLLGVPKQLSDLLTRLSATWAAKLDTLHDSRLTSARAGYLDKLNLSGKALDDAMWTNAKAGYLDMAISAVCRIKSIQKVSVSINNTLSSATATITAVNTSKTILIPTGHIAPNTDYTDPDALTAAWQLTNSTTVTFSRGGALSGAMVGYCQVIEFY